MEKPNYIDNFSYSNDYMEIKKTTTGWVYIIKGINPRDKDFIKDQVQAAFEAYAQANKAIHNWHEKAANGINDSAMEQEIQELHKKIDGINQRVESANYMTKARLDSLDSWQKGTIDLWSSTMSELKEKLESKLDWGSGCVGISLILMAVSFWGMVIFQVWKYFN